MQKSGFTLSPVVKFGVGVGISILLAACATSQAPAPVVSRTSQSGQSGEPAAAPAQDMRGYYRVKKGDTLFRIAVDVGQSYRDIVAWNGLTNPNDIKVDQLLRVIPPEANAPAGPGNAQVGSISGGSGIEVRSLGAPAAGAGAAAAPLALPPGAAVNKSGPRGDKRPYSDAALAELEKPDTSVTSTAVVSTPVPVGAPPASGALANGQSAAPAAPAAAQGTGSAAANSGTDDDALAWGWPAEGKVVSNFSAKKGLDIAGKLGQPVLAAGDGKVMYAGAGIRGYGNLVIVKHNNNLLSAYAHNRAILVKEGQQVTKGQKIAEMGSSDTDSVKLHFEIRQQGKPVDPAKYLPAR